MEMLPISRALAQHTTQSVATRRAVMSYLTRLVRGLEKIPGSDHLTAMELLDRHADLERLPAGVELVGIFPGANPSTIRRVRKAVASWIRVRDFVTA